MEVTITKDRQDLERLEGVIQRNLQSFYEVGRSLMEIRDRELYKVKNGGAFTTFEAYCREVWDFNSSRARQLIAATETVDAVKTVTIVTPSNEGQARPLMKLPAEKQKQAWQKAVETAPEGKVTAAHVQKVVNEMIVPKPKSEPTPKPELPKAKLEPEKRHPCHAVYFAISAISHLERIADDDPTKNEALDQVQEWIDRKRKEWSI